jgi:hypothetical protein
LRKALRLRHGLRPAAFERRRGDAVSGTFDVRAFTD